MGDDGDVEWKETARWVSRGEEGRERGGDREGGREREKGRSSELWGMTGMSSGRRLQGGYPEEGREGEGGEERSSVLWKTTGKQTARLEVC